MARPFFIVGSGRCGSTWLYRVLREHPHLALTNEAGVLNFLYNCNLLAGTPHNATVELAVRHGAVLRGIVHEREVEAFAPLFTSHAKTICETFYRQRFPDRDYRYWGEKLPDPRAAVSAAYVWPEARYLVLVRDPRDVLCSWRSYAQREGIARDFPEIVGMTALSFARSWQAVYRGFLDELDGALQWRYEDLRENPRRHVAALLDALGLDWAEALDGALDAEAARPVHSTAPDPARTTGRWRDELSAPEVREIEAVCGELMRQFGYALDGGN